MATHRKKKQNNQWLKKETFLHDS